MGNDRKTIQLLSELFFFYPAKLGSAIYHNIGQNIVTPMYLLLIISQ